MLAPLSLWLAKYRIIIRNIAWLSVASALVKPIWFAFITIACARVLGAEGYGILTTALSLAALGFALTSFGVNQYIVRDVSADRASAAKYFTNFLVLRLGLVLLAAPATIMVAHWLGYTVDLFVAVLIVCVYQSAVTINEYGQSFFQAFEDLRYQALAVILEKVLVVGFGALFLLRLGTASGTLIGMSVGILCAATVTLFVVQRRMAPFQFRELDASFVARSLRQLVPFGIASVLGMFFFRIDTIIIEAMLGLEPAGQYGLGFRIVEALNMLPYIVVFAAVYPTLSRLWRSGSIDEVGSLVRLVIVALLASSILIATPIMLLAPTLIGLIAADPALIPAGHVLQILVWSFPLTCVRTLLYASLLAMGAQRYLAFAIGGGLLLNVVLNLVLIPQIGIVGAAAATIVSEFFLIGLLSLRYKGILKPANV